MSHAAVMTALYRLFYKRSEREAFAHGGTLDVAGLEPSERAMLAAVNPARLARSAELHAAELGAAWYSLRTPATWLALKAAFACEDGELAMRLAQSSAFELHVDDDRTVAALTGFVTEELRRPTSVLKKETPWVGELLRYERAIAGLFAEAGGKQPTYLLLEFGWNIPAIWASLLDRKLCPTGERLHPNWMVVYLDRRGVNEARIGAKDAQIMRALLGRGATSLGRAARGQGAPEGLPPEAWQRCASLLIELAEG